MDWYVPGRPRSWFVLAHCVRWWFSWSLQLDDRLDFVGLWSPASWFNLGLAWFDFLTYSDSGCPLAGRKNRGRVALGWYEDSDSDSNADSLLFFVLQQYIFMSRVISRGFVISTFFFRVYSHQPMLNVVWSLPFVCFFVFDVSLIWCFRSSDDFIPPWNFRSLV